MASEPLVIIQRGKPWCLGARDRRGCGARHDPSRESHNATSRQSCQIPWTSTQAISAIAWLAPVAAPSDHSAKAPKRGEMQAAHYSSESWAWLRANVGNTKPAVCSPATETSASPPGATTGNGNNGSAIARRAASH